MGYSPWGRRESDTTERLSKHIARSGNDKNLGGQETHRIMIIPQRKEKLSGVPTYSLRD